MTGSYLFNYESYYNGLMTDLGYTKSIQHLVLVTLKTTCALSKNNVSFFIK